MSVYPASLWLSCRQTRAAERRARLLLFKQLPTKALTVQGVRIGRCRGERRTCSVFPLAFCELLFAQYPHVVIGASPAVEGQGRCRSRKSCGPASGRGVAAGGSGRPKCSGFGVAFCCTASDAPRRWTTRTGRRGVLRVVPGLGLARRDIGPGRGAVGDCPKSAGADRNRDGLLVLKAPSSW